MKTGKTFAELEAELKVQRAAMADVTRNTGVFELSSNGTSHLHIEGAGSFEVLDTAHDQIMQRLDIPKKFYDRIRKEHPKLLDVNVNTFFKAKNEVRMVRTIAGKARAYLSDRYRKLDNWPLFKQVKPLLDQPGVRVESADITEKKFYLKVINERLNYDVKVGDPVQAGLIISNSEIGHGALSIQPLIFRLRCLNGMIAADATIRKYHVGRASTGSEAIDEMEYLSDETIKVDDHAVYLKIRDAMAHIFSEGGFESFAKRFGDASKEKIDVKPFEMIETVVERFNLNEDERDGILTEYLKEGDESKFGLINAVTAYSQKVDSYDRATELEKLGGTILELPKTAWQEIAIAA